MKAKVFCGNLLRRSGLALLSLMTASVAGARDLESSCWFYAGFDSPIRIAGGEFPTQPAAAGYREGRYGQGYYFHSPAENALPPMAEVSDIPTQAGGILLDGKDITELAESLVNISLVNRNGYGIRLVTRTVRGLYP